MSKIGSKARKRNKPQMERKLWKVFSEYIRLRDSNSQGVGKCISCGKWLHWKEAHAGHYIPRVAIFKAIKYHEWNVNLQCPYCNKFLEGNSDSYRSNLIDKIGKEAVDWLSEHKRDGLNWKISDYEEKIEYYKNQVKELKKIKGLE
jgi:predicted RNA-binding Zn-ribbon protein involved in translation (DUF1610 family)